MSSNLAVVNFSVGGTLTISGVITLGEKLTSINSASFRGLETTDLNVSGGTTFNSELPTSMQTPTQNKQLTTKIYVDNLLTETDSNRKTYIDDADKLLCDRIESTDLTRKTYIDDADKLLYDRIESTDLTRKTYIDDADKLLYDRITSLEDINTTYASGTIINMKISNRSDAGPLFYAKSSRQEMLGGYGPTFFYTTKSNNSTLQLNFNAQGFFFQGVGNISKVTLSLNTGNDILSVRQFKNTSSGYNSFNTPDCLSLAGAYQNTAIRKLFVWVDYVTTSYANATGSNPQGSDVEFGEAYLQLLSHNFTITEIQN